MGVMAEAQSGVCDLCGQELILTDDDCWHPFNVEKACPPETHEGGLVTTAFGTFFRPGREHWRPARG